MKISYSDACIFEVVGQTLRHFFGKGRNKDLLALFGGFVYLSYQVVNLTLAWNNGYFRVKKSRRPYYLLGCNASALFFFVGCRCGAYIYGLIDYVFKFLEFERSVIQCRRQSEAVVHKRGFP